ncbi:hypothetical protein BUALT_Bualt19G0062800 [Buddleja alternifolia]|uniref:RanBP2-type domain-containing protein n=1 Tax=Buddleja alternifolia TaxID=168488 RepID=A0AAV6W2A3_9LAMI|nr:hypothetical protein BUALT_Bualt19G0062800 [Buddleja alternifolia]
MALSHLLLRRLKYSKTLSQIPYTLSFASLSNAPDSTNQSPTTPKPTSLSARMSFIFEQIDEIDKQREEKDQTLQRIRAWRDSKNQKNNNHSVDPVPDPPELDSVEDLKSELAKSEALLEVSNVKKEVELVHPWAEWIELMERLVQQNYFDHKRKDEDGMMEGLGIDLSEGVAEEDKGIDFMRDFKTVQAAVINFGRDRFDILRYSICSPSFWSAWPGFNFLELLLPGMTGVSLRSLSRQDLQILVGYGCPSADKRVVFSSKLLRKHVHLDEGDVCSSCSLRSSCEKAYLLTNKEDEPRTIDVMRVLLTYGFDPIDGLVANKSLLKMKTVKTVVRKLLHEVVKLSSVPIDPNLPPPVFIRPPPKVKQPPPPPRKRVGRNDIEMKKGDWLCPKCDFMNFAKNTVCLQCDAKRPKRQLLPGEWECPQCNFLNYRRNTVCFHCEHNRPPDSYNTEPQFPEKQHGGPRMRMDKNTPNKMGDVSNAWNFDFDDNESDGADVAAFEYADSRKLDEDFPLNNPTRGAPKVFDRDYSESGPTKPGVGFNDFDEDEDDDDIESYELVTQNDPKTSRVDFSELEADDSEYEDIQSTDKNWHARGKTSSQTRPKKHMHRKASMADSEDDEVDFDTDDDLPSHPKWKSSHVANAKRENRERHAMSFVSDDDLWSDDENLRSKGKGNKWGSNGVDRKTGGRGKPSFKADNYSETDSDDNVSNYRDKQRNKSSRGRGGSRNSGFDRHSDSQRNSSRGVRESSYNGREKNGRGSKVSKFRSHRGGGLFDKRGGKSHNFDNQSESYMDDEIQRRPRKNVR